MRARPPEHANRSLRLADRGIHERGSGHAVRADERHPMSVTEVPALRIELGPAAEAIGGAGRRLADLLANMEEPDRGIRGLEWTLGELVAHVAARSERFAAYLSGAAVPEGEIAGIAEANRRDVRERRERPLADMLEALRWSLSSF